MPEEGQEWEAPVPGQAARELARAVDQAALALPVSRGLMQVVQPDPGAALARWADQQADPLADLRAAFHLADQADLEELAAQGRYLQASLERAAAGWYQQVARPMAEALERGVVHLSAALAPLGAALAELPLEDRVERLRQQVAEVQALADCLDQPQWTEADLDPAWSSQEGLAAAGLLGVLAPREGPGSPGAAGRGEAGRGSALLADLEQEGLWRLAERQRHLLNYHLLAVQSPSHLCLLTGL